MLNLDSIIGIFSPRLKEFARRIRSEATGLLQRCQIIENEERRKRVEVFTFHRIATIGCNLKGYKINHNLSLKLLFNLNRRQSASFIVLYSKEGVCPVF